MGKAWTPMVGWKALVIVLKMNFFFLSRFSFVVTLDSFPDLVVSPLHLPFVMTLHHEFTSISFILANLFKIHLCPSVKPRWRALKVSGE